MVPSKKLKETG
jgi:hypothetical protein